MSRGGGELVVVPWEHLVCAKCLREYPHAIWLIKLRCFKPKTHYGWRLVSIEPSSMKLVEMRHPPLNIEQSNASIPPCLNPSCKRGRSCSQPHSEVEYQTWEFIRTTFKDNGLKRLLCDSKLTPQSPTDACDKCYGEASPFYNTRWLTWLECAKHTEHENEIGVTLIVGDDHEVVEVLELPKSLNGKNPQTLTQCRGCRNEVNCKKAHSFEELQHWKWTLIHRVLRNAVPSYKSLREKYSYEPHEGWLSATQVGIDQKLSAENYVNKFHHLICLDQVAHGRVMANLCNGKLTIREHWFYDRRYKTEVFQLKLYGMEGAAMDYAVHGHAVAHITLGQYDLECPVDKRDTRENALLLKVNSRHMPQLPQKPVYVHFEINHHYFEGLHKAVDCLSQYAVAKIFPNEAQMKAARRVSVVSGKEAVEKFTLDHEYQASALRGMISSDPRVPFLVIGPFGTGKTRIIAAVVSALFRDPKSHILVCTYQHQCANSIYQMLVMRFQRNIMRLAPNEGVVHVVRSEMINSSDNAIREDHLCILTLKQVKVKDIQHKKVIVTTFLTATNLKQMEAKSRTQLHFSHILIDEGAQAREPESLGALAVVKEETKIVIVGDHKQSGPKVAVLSELAQEYELGVSLLVRLFDLYESKDSKVIMKNHTASLLTNYRCHSSILAFTSSLFYQHTLLSRSSSETHPLAPFPLLFTCSSIDENTRKLPAEDQHGAEVLIKALCKFAMKWPRTTPKQKVGVLCSARKQCQLLKQKVKQFGEDLACEIEVVPTYRVQGSEFDAVFLSTIEPTRENGEIFDPVRSMSNELVFNTIITRARSLIYCVGNPFTLCKIGDSSIWKAYIRRCVQCETLDYALPKTANLDQAAKKIQEIVFPTSVIDEATNVALNDEADKIIDKYIENLNQRREYKTGCKLVQKPEGRVDWMMENEKETDESVVLCRIEYKQFDKATAVPLDGSQPLELQGRGNLRGAFHQDQIKVDTSNRRVLLDERTERAMDEARFGHSFLCRVSEFSCIQFYPLDKRYPKFVNLPTISREEKMGVVCFDPSSLNDSPKVSNVIPHQVALRMVFVVKFLKWKKKYPLGIIVGAIPSQSPHFRWLILQMQHNIPGVIVDNPIESAESAKTVFERRHFPLAITIDPQGSTDHDDALTCTVRVKNNRKIYTVGVHITDLQCMVRKGSELDKQAKKRGCTVYNAPDSICSPMFPDSVLEAASIQPGKKLNCFSVLSDFVVSNEGSDKESIALASLQICKSSITSEAELTYKEAQCLLMEHESCYTELLKGKAERYNALNSTFSLKVLIKLLWKFAWFLRQRRLKDAAMAYTVREVDQLKNPEAHYLVEELMIRANTQVAKMLSRELENQTILRSQKPPDEKELEQFIKQYKMVLPLSATCKVLNPPLPPTVSPLTMLKSQHSLLVENLRKKKLVDVKHCVQMEHLHPQLLALQSRLRSLQSSAEYCVLKRGDRDGGSHSDLQCSHYTHFTSPLRRYIDLIIQRQLHGALMRGSNVYTPEELESLGRATQKLLKHSQEYEREFKSAEFANALKASQQVYDCIISDVDVKKQTLSLCFTDIELHLRPKASKISSYQLQKNHSTLKPTVESEATIHYQWKLKVCSMKQTPASFLHPDQIEVSPDKGCQLSFYTIDESNCLDKKMVSVKTKSNVVTIHDETWLMMQRCIMEGTDSLEQHREKILKELPLVEGNATLIPHTDWRAILLVYTLSRELKLFDVMKAQLCAAQVKKGLMQEPAIQLMEVGPGFRICVQHNKDPEKCFVGSLLQQASKKSYDSIPEYIKCWEPLILSESALTSVKESEFLLVRDVVLEWPEFQLYTSSSGESYYTMTENSDRDKNGVKLSLDSQFLNTSFNFFKMSEGDLVCIRLSSSEGDTRYVFHMVINNVNISRKKTEVYMKFVQRKSNRISPDVHRVLNSQRAQYEVQLIHSSLSQRRIYRSLKSLSLGTDLARRIAMGNYRNQGYAQRMDKVLSRSEMKVALSYWPLKEQRHDLNKYQIEGLESAWGNKFTMIQGPPGTGKSVTGAHIAYALAMRLSKETHSEGQCVMYCGPSQHSVNVVLDKFIDLLSSSKEKVSIIRVFSKGVEKLQNPGPELDKDVFVPVKAGARCEKPHEKYSLHHKVRELKPEIIEMEARFKDLNRQGRIASFKDMSAYRAIISEAEESVLKSGVNIILCTCNEAASHRITNTVEPKYCIIDECAMATEPECMVPIRRAQHVVLIGDHQQLQPVINSREAEKMGLGKSLFERYANRDYRIHILRRQYRMHPAICEFPSKAFYGGELETAESVRKRQSGLNLDGFWPSGEQCPIVFCQVEGEEETGHIGSQGHNKVDSQSKYNTTEAKKIVDIAEKLVCQYKVPHSSIAVLTPYSAQKEAISDELKHRVEQHRRKRQEERRLEDQIQVKTITESQGSEYGIVLLSTVRSQRMAGEESEAADIDWIRKNLGFVADPHRICVGITRSKFGLVIVGNEKVLKYDPVWKKLIRHYKDKRCYIAGDRFPR